MHLASVVYGHHGWNAQGPVDAREARFLLQPIGEPFRGMCVLAGSSLNAYSLEIEFANREHPDPRALVTVDDPSR